MYRLFAFLFLFLLPEIHAVDAANVPNTFGSYTNFNSAGCPTYGAFSQSALTLITRSRSLLEELRGRCSGIEPTLAELAILEREVNRLTLSKMNQNEIIRTQANVEWLTSLASTIPVTDVYGNALNAVQLTTVGSALADQRVKLAMLTAETESSLQYAESVRQFGTLPALTASLQSIQKQLPILMQCPATKPSLIPQVISMLMPAVAAFGTPAVAVASTATGILVRDLFEFIKDMRYSNYMRSLEEIEMFASLNCMMESAQFSICSAQDGLRILEWGEKDEAQDAPTQQSTNKSNAWIGYNILTRDMGTLTEWMQSFVNSMKPGREEDTEFPIATDLIEFSYRSKKNAAYASINSALSDVNPTSGNPISDQRTRGKELFRKLFTLLSGERQGSFSSEDRIEASINIYTRELEASELALYLVQKTRKELSEGLSNPSEMSNFQLVVHPDNTAKLPINLVDLINTQFNKLLLGDKEKNLRGTEEVISDLLSSRRVEDENDLITRAVRESAGSRSALSVLEDMQVWLNDLINHGRPSIFEIYKHYTDPETPTDIVMEHATKTKTAIDEVLTTLRTKEITVPDPKDPSKKITTKILDSDKIKAIGKSLNVVKSRDRYLPQRISTLVQIQLRSLLSESPSDQEIKDIADSSSRDLYQKILDYGKYNREKTKWDLEQSIDMQRKHLDLMFKFFKKQFVKFLKTAPMPTKEKACARTLSLSSVDPDVQKICAGIVINSIYNPKAPTGLTTDASSQPQKIQLPYDYFSQRPHLERECALRNYFRATELYEIVHQNRSLSAGKYKARTEYLNKKNP